MQHKQCEVFARVDNLIYYCMDALVCGYYFLLPASAWLTLMEWLHNGGEEPVSGITALILLRILRDLPPGLQRTEYSVACSLGPNR